MKLDILPVNDNNNGWLGILPPPSAPGVLAGDHLCDYAVVGAGFTGLAAARRLAELKPDARIALIDGGRIGNNAAGRCSGFAIDLAHNIRQKTFAGGTDHEQAQLRLNRAGQDALRKAVTENQIDCDWLEKGKIHGAATRRGQKLLRRFASQLDLLGKKYQLYGAEKMKEVTGVSFYREGLFTPGTIQLQPAALVRGLAGTQPENVSVYENCLITEVVFGEKSSDTHELIGAHGKVSAKTLILANNGFGVAFGFYRKHVLPVTTYASMTRRLGEREIKALGGENAWGIVPAHSSGSSVRRLTEDRILIRSLYFYTRGHNPTERQRQSAMRRHQKSFRNRFPMLDKVELEYSWGGTLCLSGDGNPIFGELRPRVFASLCHNGVGVARGTICGELIAEAAVGRESELLDIMRHTGRPRKIPPAWMLRLGAPANLANRRRAAGLEL